MAYAMRPDPEAIRAWSAHAAQGTRESLRRFGGEVAATWRGLSLTLRLALGAAILLVLAVFIFLAQPNWNWARGAVGSLVSARLHRPVTFDGDLRVHLFSFTPSAAVRTVRVGQPVNFVKDAPKDDLAYIDALSASVQLLPLFVGHVVLPRVQVDKPDVVLFQDGAGHANWDFSNGANKGQAAHLPLIRNFIIHDGHIRMQSLSRDMRFYGTVEAHEKADAGGQAFGLTGDGRLNGKDFTVKASGGPLLNVHSGTPYPFDMTVQAGGTQIVAKGQVLHPFDLGLLQGAVTVSGGNLADLYYLTGLTLPDTPAYRLSAQVRRDERTYQISGIDGRVGHSDLEGALKVVLGRDGRPDLSGDLTSKRLDFKDLGALFGATSANAPQGATVALNPEPTAATRRLLPDVPLDAARVRGMDADVHYRAQSVNASPNLPLRGVDLGVRLDHGLMKLAPIAFQFPQGRLKGTAKIDARDKVQQNSVDFTVSDIAVQQFTPQFQGAEPIEGRISARLQATGGGSTVHDAASTANGRFALVMSGGTVRQSLAELMGVDATKGLFMLLSKDPHQTDVRCAVADFAVKNGVMTAQRIVFDTGVVVVNGSGRIDMQDESLKLVFKGKAKKFRLVHLNAPIVIGGHLTQPSFGVDPGPALAQGGVGAALSTLSGGLAILPFLNLNGAPDANCAALEAAAHQHGAPKK
jgi:uncharacterized protein involved in outer membrane biogenesis